MQFKTRLLTSAAVTRTIVTRTIVTWAILVPLLSAEWATADVDAQSGIMDTGLAENSGVTASTASGPVRNGCIASHRIRRVSFDDDRTGTLELAGRQQVSLTLKSSCSGIRFNGYVHRPVNRRFCEGDILRVTGSGGFCVVETLQAIERDDDPDADLAPSGEES